jgi:putative transposase
MKPWPKRKLLPHDVPSWVKPEEATYFLTICCRVRHQNQLALDSVARELFETVSYRNQKQIWFAQVFLLMPDHAHALISFPRSGKSIKSILSQWKEWTAKQVRIDWERDFFEHRLRREESLQQKADYILNNPVRAGLVQNTEDWPYVWLAGS